MPFLYICTPCFTLDNTNIFYTTSDKGAITTCPTCRNKSAKFQRSYKNKTKTTKFARSYEEAFKRTDRNARASRNKPNPWYTNERFDTPKTADVARQYNPALDEGAEEDPEYVPQVDFRPDMRFSDPSWGTLTCRNPNAFLVNHVFTMTTADHQITAKANRADTGTAMALVLPVGNLKKISAYSWANWQLKPPQFGQPYTTDKKRSLEWCHLVADSLGGPTQADNLVAASYGANTFMMTIEEKLNAKTNLVIQITVHCCKDHVAEFIYYKVRKGTATKTWIIDARNDNFGHADYVTVGKEVMDFIK